MAPPMPLIRVVSAVGFEHALQCFTQAAALALAEQGLTVTEIKAREYREGFWLEYGVYDEKLMKNIRAQKRMSYVADVGHWEFQIWL